MKEADWRPTRMTPCEGGPQADPPADPNGQPAEAALSELVSAARPAPVTFHRAFDEAGDPLAALEALARTGVTRVLTGGGRGTAWEGQSTLGHLVRVSAGRVTIMAGGAVRSDHVVQLVQATGVTEVHARASAIPDLVAALGGSAQDAGPFTGRRS